MNEKQNFKPPFKAVQETHNMVPRVWYVMDANGNKMALSDKESVDAIVEALNNQADAKFMADVWQYIRKEGWEAQCENGDPDGVDFVAARILSRVQS